MSTPKYKFLRLNFDDYVVKSSKNEIYILKDRTLDLVQILRSHDNEISLMTVSGLRKAILSMSNKTFVVHGLVEDSQMQQEGCREDTQTYFGKESWEEKWRFELTCPILKEQIQDIQFSNLGDFFLLGGKHIFQIWRQEFENEYIYTPFYQVHNSEFVRPLANPAPIVEDFKEMKEIKQIRVSDSGRLAATLETHVLRIWYQDQKEAGVQGTGQDAVYLESVDEILKRAEEEQNKTAITVKRNKGERVYTYFCNNSLKRAEIRPQNEMISFFKFLPQKMETVLAKPMPEIIFTCSRHHQIGIWVESMSYGPLNFQLCQVLRGFGPFSEVFDFTFLSEYESVKPEDILHFKSSQVSLLFDPAKDPMLEFKDKNHQDRFEVAESNQRSLSQDFFGVMNSKNFYFYKFVGLRNYPQGDYQIIQISKGARLHFETEHLLLPCMLYFMSCKEGSDFVQIRALSQDQRLVKFQKSIKDSEKSIFHYGHNQCLDPYFVPPCVQARSSPSFNLVAFLSTSKTVIYFYEAQVPQPIGSYSKNGCLKMKSVYDFNDKQIKTFQWVAGQKIVAVQMEETSEVVLLKQSGNRNHFLTIWSEIGRIAPFKDRPDLAIHSEFQTISFVEEDDSVAIAFISSSQNNLIEVFNLEMIGETSVPNLVLSKKLDEKILQIYSLSLNHSEKSLELIYLSEYDPANPPPVDPEYEAEEEEEEEEPDQNEDDDSEDGDLFAVVSKPKKDTQQQKKKATINKASAFKPYSLQVCQLKLKVTQEKNQACRASISVQWRSNVPQAFKQTENILKSSSSSCLWAVLVSDNEDKLLHIYDRNCHAYQGFISLKALTGLQDLDSEAFIDFNIVPDSEKAQLVVAYKNYAYLLCQGVQRSVSQETYKYSVADKFKFQDRGETPTSIKVSILPNSKLCILLNQKHLVLESKVQADSLQKTTFEHQTSLSIFDFRVLKQLYIVGFQDLVLKIIVKIKQALEENQTDTTNFLDYDHESLLKEIRQVCESSKAPVVKKKVQTAAALFSNFSIQENDEEENNIKKEEKTPAQILEEKFSANFEAFLDLIEEKGPEILRITQDQASNLREIIHKFSFLRSKVLDSDTLSCLLLRKIMLNLCKLPKRESEEQKEETKKGFDMQSYVQEIYHQQQKAESANLEKLQSHELTVWSSLEVAMALHTEHQDVVMNELLSRVDSDNVDWELLNRTSMPLWLKDINVLRDMAERVAKTAYKQAQKESDFGKGSKAEKTAMWYMAMDKKSMLCALYKQEPASEKVYQMLMNDFSQQRWKSAAEKNAMVLMTKKNYQLSIAFFLLAKNLEYAVQVAQSRMNDINLAIMICRLFHSQEPAMAEAQLDQLYQRQFVERGQEMNEIWLQNIGLWQQKKYVESLNCLDVRPLARSVQKIDSMFAKPSELNRAQLDGFNLLLEGRTEAIQEFPVLTPQVSHLTLEVVIAIKKNHLFKRALNGEQGPAGTGKGIMSRNLAAFDSDDEDGDLMSAIGGGKKVEAAEGEQQKVVLKEEEILQQILTSLVLAQAQSVLALALAIQHKELVSRLPTERSMLVRLMLKDLALQPGHRNLAQNNQRACQSVCSAFQTATFECENELKRHLVRHGRAAEICHQLIENPQTFQTVQGQIGCLRELDDEASKMHGFISHLSQNTFAYQAEIKNPGENQAFMDELLRHLELLLDNLINFQFTKQASVDTPELQLLRNNTVDVRFAQTLQRTDDVDESASQGKPGIAQRSQEARGGTIKVHQAPFNPDRPTHLSQLTILEHLQEIDPFTKLFLEKVSYELRIAFQIYLTLLFLSVQANCYTNTKETLHQLKKLARFEVGLSDTPEVVEAQVKRLKIDYQLVKTVLQKQVKPALEKGFEVSEPVEAKEAEVRREKIDHFICLWLKYVSLYQTFHVMQPEKKLAKNELKLKVAHFVNHFIRDGSNTEEQLFEILSSNIQFAHKQLEKLLTYFSEHLLTQMERETIAQDLHHLSDEDFKKLKTSYIDLTRFFAGEKTKFTEFANFIGLSVFIDNLFSHTLSLTCTHRTRKAFEEQKATTELYQTGITLYSRRTESIANFALDNGGSDILAACLLQSGIREIPTEGTLLYRKRDLLGHQIEDEECLDWNDCLHRFDNFKKNVPQNSQPVIKAAHLAMFQEKTLNYQRPIKNQRLKNSILTDAEPVPPKNWARIGDVTDFTRVNNSSLQQRWNVEVNHMDHMLAVEAHPYLPLYLSGNLKGQICLWQFGQSSDKCLDQWHSLTDTRAVAPKQHGIHQLQFNDLGDKFLACNQEGKVFLFNFDLDELSRTQPIFQLKKPTRILQASFINRDTVFGIALGKGKGLQICDTLLPPRQSVVMEVEKASGNLFEPMRSMNQVICFNSDKPGILQEIDLRKGLINTTKSIHTEEVTATASVDKTLLVGTKDGQVKVFDWEQGNLELRESIPAFPANNQAGVKKGQVSCLRVSKGALFASSLNSGQIKLLRSRI